jgi:hypothetical protein
MAGTNLTKTFTGGNGGSNWTTSFWIKRSKITLQQDIFEAHSSSTYHTDFLFKSDDTIQFMSFNGSTSFKLKTNRVFRDTNAWYHIVLQYIASGDSGVYAKIYVNGVQETSLSVNTQGAGGTQWNNNCVWTIGSDYAGLNDFDGCISHFHHCDGSVLAPTVFGSVDSTTGQWKLNTSPSFTPGTNGFTILKDGNIITDQSANSNNWSLASGTLTKTEDSPSNVFATLNPLVTYGTNQNALSEGNNTLTGISYHRPSPPTISVNSGKWYFEAKALSGTSTKWWIGLCDTEYDTNNQGATSSTANYIWGYDGTTNAVNQRSQIIYGNDLRDGGSNIAISGIFSAGTIAVNDIYAMAVDLDNQKVWYSKNGVWNNGSGGESTTFNASTPDSTNIDAGRDYLIGIGGENSKWSINYGNGYFGTTAVSSAGTNASGIGIFEYDCPTGYTALSTKGLNL